MYLTATDTADSRGSVHGSRRVEAILTGSMLPSDWIRPFLSLQASTRAGREREREREKERERERERKRERERERETERDRERERERERRQQEERKETKPL